MKKSFVMAFAFGLILSACEKKPAGFGVEDSHIRYQTKKFPDPEVLAEVNGQKFTRNQILDKSAVLKDLAQQENEGLIALAYMKIADQHKDTKPQGTIEIFLPETQTPLSAILNRFDRDTAPGLNITFKSGGEEGAVARFKDDVVKREELNADHVVFQSIEQRRFREIATQLNAQMSRILVAEQAQSAKEDLQKFLREKVFGGELSVSPTELSEYLKKIGFAESELTDELRGRFTDALKQHKEQKMIENYAAKNLIKGPVDVAFTEPQTRMNLSDSFTPVMGYKDAPVSLIAFSSANCPDCIPFIEALKDVMKKHDGHLRLNWIHKFNETDGIARMMAEAALCVDSVKKGKVVDFLEAFAKKSDQVDEQAFYQWGEKNGIKTDEFKNCIVGRRNDQLLTQHLEYARRVGVVANPTLWVEGRTLQGVITGQQLDQIVEQNIKSKGSSSLKALWRRVKGWFST